MSVTSSKLSRLPKRKAFKGNLDGIVHMDWLKEWRQAQFSGSRRPLKRVGRLDKDVLDVTRGSGNAFRDLGHTNADIEQFKAILAAEIIKALDRQGLSVREAHSQAGIAAADFSRIRNADLSRFTVDRLMSIINRLGSRIEVKINLRRVENAQPAGTGALAR